MFTAPRLPGAIVLSLNAVLSPLLLVTGKSSLRDAFLSWLVNRFGLLEVTEWSISFFSTIPERALLFLFCAAGLGASFFLVGFLVSPLLRLLLPALSAFLIFLGLYSALPRSAPVATALSLALLVGILQLPFWMRGRNQGGKPGNAPVAAWLPSVILAPALAALLLDGWELSSLARKLRADEAVQQLAAGDLYSLEVDAEQGQLFVTTESSDHLLAYNTGALDQAPRKSETETAGAQYFAFLRPERELYFFNRETRSLLVLDATTLAVKKSMPGLNLSEGDCTIAVDRHANTVIIASEAGWPARDPGKKEDKSASPIVVVERTTGKVLYGLQWCDGGFCNPGNILPHPGKPLLYMCFIDRVLAYDTKLRKAAASSQAGDRWIGDKMALTPDQQELLVPSPLHSDVLRFDALTLEFKGRIGTVFGVRALAVDASRNLLLAGSGLTSMVDVIDLRTRRRVAKHYVGPWLRAIAVDQGAGIAYVSSARGLFRVDYGRGRPSP